MKNIFQASKLFLLNLFVLTAACSYAQQQFTHTVTELNKNCNANCSVLDVPELNNNPIAIILVTPVVANGMNLNPHPIGVLYTYLKKWSIINLDQTPIAEGAKFNVLYFLNPGPDRFVYIVPTQVRESDVPYIDHAGLNDNPNAQIRFFPLANGGHYNKDDIKVEYDATVRKWYIANINNKQVPWQSVYNIVIGSPESITTNLQIPKNPVKAEKNLDSAKVVVLSPTTPVTQPVQPKNPVKDEKPLDSAKVMVLSPTIPVTQPAQPVLLPAIVQGTLAPQPPKLYGFMDMHTHPVSQLGFGEQLFYGDNDGDPNIALGSCNCIHNFIVPPFDGNCSQQNKFRNEMVDDIDPHSKVRGYPDFKEWPRYNSLLHQQMWIEWIKRAKEGGLRVMVALAVNNHTIADAAETGGSNDDLGSMNKQLIRMKALFSRHPDFVEIAYTSADLRRIVMAGKLAVILGIEMDNIGNFYNPADHKGASYNPNPTEAQIKSEIDRLFNLGVRYIFPIHITNNVFGGTALYYNAFNIPNKYNTGTVFVPEAVSSVDGITFRLTSPSQELNHPAFVNMGFTWSLVALFNVVPANIMPDPLGFNYPSYPSPEPNNGHRNSLGLTPKGEVAIRYMMQKGMMIDIDHMSEKSAETVLNMAISYNYPVNSGHNGFRGAGANNRGIGADNENARTDDQVRKIYGLGGIMGLGHGGHSTNFVNNYRYGLTLSGGEPLAIGTDVNGFFALPAAPMAFLFNPSNFHPLEAIAYGPTLTKCVTGVKTWDFNTEGMAHYGLLPDYIESCRKVGMTTAEQNAFFLSAERFAQMWEKCNTSKTNVH